MTEPDGERTDYEMILIRIILIISCLLPVVVKLKTGFHMLQQEYYLNKEYLHWAKKNIRKNISLWDIFAPIAAVVVGVVWGYIVWTIINLIAVLVKIKTAPKAKKPLVFTARVKRMTATAAVISAVLATGLYILLTVNFVYAAIAVAVFNIIAFLFAPLVNIINRPVELAVNRWYYNDAKKTVSSMNNLKIIGVTGSYGKTSVKFVLSKMLSEKYHTLMTPESYNTTMGVIRVIRSSLTPAHEVFVCEMGARYTGEIKEICDLVNPDYGIITAVGPQHLETFGSIENIVKTKYELEDAVADKANMVINAVSEVGKDRIPENALTYSFSKEEGGKFYAENVSYGPAGASFTLCGEGIEPFEIQTRLLGKLNILNVIGAAAMALKLGVSPQQISYAARRLQPVPHRLEMKKQGGITIIDDAFNSNVEGSKAAVEVLGSFPEGGRMLITPGMVELGDKEFEYNCEFGRKAAENSDFIILVGEDRAVPIKQGITEAGFDETRLYIAKDLNDALAKMHETVQPGWTVLLENDLPDLYL